MTSRLTSRLQRPLTKLFPFHIFFSQEENEFTFCIEPLCSSDILLFKHIRNTDFILQKVCFLSRNVIFKPKYVIYPKYAYPYFDLKLRYPFDADISILRRDIFSALIQISAFEIQNSCINTSIQMPLKYNYISICNLDIFILALLQLPLKIDSVFKTNYHLGP